MIEEVMRQLKTIFPDIHNIPRPIQMLRSKWRQDEFARGSYTACKVDMNPLSFGYLAQVRLLGQCINPYVDSHVQLKKIQALKNRLYFGGESTSANRPGYVDGAYMSGLREAQKVMKSPNRYLDSS